MIINILLYDYQHDDANDGDGDTPGDTVKNELRRLYISWHNPEATSANCCLFPNVDFNMIDDDHPQNDDDYNPEINSHNDDKFGK